MKHVVLGAQGVCLGRLHLATVDDESIEEARREVRNGDRALVRAVAVRKRTSVYSMIHRHAPKRGYEPFDLLDMRLVRVVRRWRGWRRDRHREVQGFQECKDASPRVCVGCNLVCRPPLPHLLFLALPLCKLPIAPRDLALVWPQVGEEIGMEDAAGLELSDPPQPLSPLVVLHRGRRREPLYQGLSVVPDYPFDRVREPSHLRCM